MKLILKTFLPLLMVGVFLPFPSAAAPTPPSGFGCGRKTGIMTEMQLESALLGKTLYFRVYTPPCYDASTAGTYPVLYLFHGSSYTDDQWDRLGMDETADRLISEGKIDPLILVLPREPDTLMDPRTSKYGNAILNELIPYIDSHYPTIPDAEHRAIGGLSRGAGWAIHLGLAHPELFGSVGAHSLAVFAGDYYLVPTWRKKTDPESLSRIYLDTGLTDEYKDSAKKFEIRLSEYSYPHEWHLNRGSHTERYWQSHVEEYLIWYSQGWVDSPAP